MKDGVRGLDKYLISYDSPRQSLTCPARDVLAGGCHWPGILALGAPPSPLAIFLLGWHPEAGSFDESAESGRIRVRSSSRWREHLDFSRRRGIPGRWFSTSARGTRLRYARSSVSRQCAGAPALRRTRLAAAELYSCRGERTAGPRARSFYAWHATASLRHRALRTTGSGEPSLSANRATGSSEFRLPDWTRSHAHPTRTTLTHESHTRAYRDVHLVREPFQTRRICLKKLAAIPWVNVSRCCGTRLLDCWETVDKDDGTVYWLAR